MSARCKALVIGRPAFLAGVASVILTPQANAHASAARDAVSQIAAAIPGQVAVFAAYP